MSDSIARGWSPVGVYASETWNSDITVIVARRLSSALSTPEQGATLSLRAPAAESRSPGGCAARPHQYFSRRSAARCCQRPTCSSSSRTTRRAADTMFVMPKTRHYFRREGVRYANGFSVTPLCCPSRSTILTGRYAHNTGVHRNVLPADLDVTTFFARLLHRAGYQTGLVGKLLNSWPVTKTPPYFDRWALGGTPYLDPTFNLNGTIESFRGYTTRVLTEVLAPLPSPLREEGRLRALALVRRAPRSTSSLGRRRALRERSGAELGREPGGVRGGSLRQAAVLQTTSTSRSHKAGE